ncbi:MAG: hypothetical protein F6K16_10290 [Symploca sp. SIO2B6]|nr:hypothetical protein [Symploca sp. SIO2B6]
MSKNSLCTRRWQERNPEKVKKYKATYDQKYPQANIRLSQQLREKIDQFKEPQQTYGGWIRKFLEEWAQKSE